MAFQVNAYMYICMVGIKKRERFVIVLRTVLQYFVELQCTMQNNKPYYTKLHRCVVDKLGLCKAKD